jgi:hypothetical protein
MHTDQLVDILKDQRLPVYHDKDDVDSDDADSDDDGGLSAVMSMANLGPVGSKAGKGGHKKWPATAKNGEPCRSCLRREQGLFCKHHQ